MTTKVSKLITDYIVKERWFFIYFSTLIFTGYFLVKLWPLFLIVWAGIAMFWSISGKIKILSETEYKIYSYSLYIYPLIGTLIKLYIFLDIIPYTYFWVNRIEHSLWAFALVILYLPFWKKLSTFTTSLGMIILIVGFVSLLGNMVEFVEYLVRLLSNLSYKYSLYYPDTIYDMFSNIAGAGIGALLILKVFKTSQKRSLNLKNQV